MIEYEVQKGRDTYEAAEAKRILDSLPSCVHFTTEEVELIIARLRCMEAKGYKRCL